MYLSLSYKIKYVNKTSYSGVCVNRDKAINENYKGYIQRVRGSCKG